MQNVECRKKKQKLRKKFEKGVDKCFFWWYYMQAVTENCTAGCREIARGPWKLNSVRQERKHTKYPLILTQYEKNPETRNCFQTMTLDVRMSYKLKIWLVQPIRLCWYHFWEFDPGSGRTLAACLTHASRTEILWTAASANGSLILVADGRVTRE